MLTQVKNPQTKLETLKSETTTFTMITFCYLNLSKFKFYCDFDKDGFLI